MIKVQVSFPPSVNKTHGGHNWRSRSSQKSQYHETVALDMHCAGYNEKPLTGRLEVTVILHARNRRAYDIQNYQKCLLDALNGYVWEDDGQIDRLIIERGTPRKPAAAIVIAREIGKQCVDEE